MRRNYKKKVPFLARNTDKSVWRKSKRMPNSVLCWERCLLLILCHWNAASCSTTEIARVMSPRLSKPIERRKLEAARRGKWPNEHWFLYRSKAWPFPRHLPGAFVSGSDQFRSEVPVNKYGWRNGIKTPVTPEVIDAATKLLQEIFREEGVDWDTRSRWVSPYRGDDAPDLVDPSRKTIDYDKINADKLKREAYRREAAIRAAAGDRPSVEQDDFEKLRSERIVDEDVTRQTKSLLDAALYLEGKRDALGLTPEESANLISRKGQRWYDERVARAADAIQKTLDSLDDSDED